MSVCCKCILLHLCVMCVCVCVCMVVVVCRSMQVRGAPLIALVACLGLSVQLKSKQDSFKDIAEAKTFILDSIVMLRESRPTAVNLFVATDELR